MVQGVVYSGTRREYAYWRSRSILEPLMCASRPIRLLPPIRDSAQRGCFT